jgi:uncharacterized protein (DUF2164 family)
LPIKLNKLETEESVRSLQRYFREEFEQEIGEMRAQFLLDYFLKEIAPFAYNQGVNDAEMYFRAKLEDLSGSCYEPGLTYWTKKRK